MERTDIVCRPMTFSDIDAVQGFLLDQLQDLFGQSGRAAITKDIWGLAEKYLQPESAGMWVAVQSDGSIVGTIAASRYNDRIVCLKGRYCAETTAEVGRCYIRADRRRQGLGERLLTQATAFCRKQGYRYLYLHTHRFLPGGFAFWQKQGFSITVEEGGPAEIVHMEKELA